ncbi:HNH endonuclease [Alphaproteobacteria bacterium]|nr:HNH endonuclease [Alphaproteobacteria bacterium]
MVYRRYRYTKKKEKSSGAISNLTALNIADLKKIKKSLENYNEKKEAHNRRILPIVEKNKKITEVYKKNKKEYDRWYDEFKEKVINKTQKQLGVLWDEICLQEIGLLSSFLEKTISIRGKYIPYATGAHLVEQYRAIENKLSMHWKKVSDTRSKLTSLTKPTAHVPSFKYQDPYISINGTRLKLDLARWTVDEVEKELNEKIELQNRQKQREQDKLNSLKSRAAKNESEVRAQAYKYRYLLDQQIAKWNGCPYCFKVMNPSDAQLDHIYPVAKGGKTAKENLVYVCSKCNRKKGKLTLNKFISKYRLEQEKVFKVLRFHKKDY